MSKTILVTGANRGIGLEICKQLADKGHTVLLGARSIEKGSEAVAKINGTVIPKKLEVTSDEDIQQLVQDIRNDYSTLDVLINNAGIMSSASTSQEDMDEAKRVLDTNLFGAWRLIQAVVPLLHASKQDPRIINMSSGMGSLNDQFSDHSAYRLSKFALNGLTLQFSQELRNIKVNAMCPGWVRTDMGGSSAHRSMEQGADTAVWLATAPEEDVPTGKFFRDRKVIPW
ncbi:MAG: SDR family oxidoreductase [Crocinitomicaceae bacterium]|nr:SDR family oxidoreductase [Crocinitomicaceae bacterium]